MTAGNGAGDPDGAEPASPAEAPASTGWALLPLRLFLGITFVFAGIQKLADPRFFRSSDPGSIQAQLHLAASASPVRPLVEGAAHIPVLVGLVLALAELAVGAGALLGLGARLAAVGGMVISAALFLTVSFYDSPYYLGSDIVFLFAWTPLALVGAGGVWSLDAHWHRLATWRPRRASGATGRVADPVAGPLPGVAGPHPGPMGRRAFLARGRPVALAGAVGLLAAGLAEWLGGRPGGAGRPRGQTRTGRTDQPMTSPGAPATASAADRPIGRAGAVTPGAALAFTDPATGDPAYLVQASAGQVVAFDAICPHARCPVGYVADSHQFVCPCHGSRFDALSGAVLDGPATVGLTRIAVTESPDGEIYAAGPPPSR